MTTWDYVWLAWLAWFLAVEGIALARKEPGDTLSEHVWKWFKVRTVKTIKIDLATRTNGEVIWNEVIRVRHTKIGWQVMVLRLVLVGFLVWLTMHLAFGWWGGGMFPTIVFTAWAW